MPRCRFLEKPVRRQQYPTICLPVHTGARCRPRRPVSPNTHDHPLLKILLGCPTQTLASISAVLIARPHPAFQQPAGRASPLSIPHPLEQFKVSGLTPVHDTSVTALGTSSDCEAESQNPNIQRHGVSSSRRHHTTTSGGQQTTSVRLLRGSIGTDNREYYGGLLLRLHSFSHSQSCSGRPADFLLGTSTHRWESRAGETRLKQSGYVALPPIGLSWPKRPIALAATLRRQERLFCIHLRRPSPRAAAKSFRRSSTRSEIRRWADVTTTTK